MAAAGYWGVAPTEHARLQPGLPPRIRTGARRRARAGGDRGPRLPRRPAARRLPRRLDLLHAFRVLDHRTAARGTSRAWPRVVPRLLRSSAASPDAGGLHRIAVGRGDHARAARAEHLARVPGRRAVGAVRRGQLALSRERTIVRRAVHDAITVTALLVARGRRAVLSRARSAARRSARARRGRRWLVGAMVGVLAAVSFADGWIAVRGGSVDRAYYGTDTRALEFLVGALLAIVLARYRGGLGDSLVPPRGSRPGWGSPRSRSSCG